MVDDDARVARSLKTLLQAHDVTTVQSGRAAMELLRAGDSFDVVFCDLMMPGVTGMDVFEQISASDPAYVPRFVFLTGGAFTPRASTFLSQVGRPCLEKPFDERAVQDALTEVLGRS